MTPKGKALEIKDEDGYVDDWEIRKYSNCHPSSATRVYTQKELNIALAEANKEIEELEHQLATQREEINDVLVEIMLWNNQRRILNTEQSNKQINKLAQEFLSKSKGAK